MVLLQATFDVVIRKEDGVPVIVDPNRRPDGHFMHVVNSNGAYLQEMTDAIIALARAGVDEGAGALHVAKKRGWKELAHGETYATVLDHMVRKAADSLGVEFSTNYGYSGIVYDQTAGIIRANNLPAVVVNYADTEPTQAREAVLKDLSVLAKLAKTMGRERFLEFMNTNWINWPTGNWMPPDVEVPGLLRKTDFYGAMSAEGYPCPDHVRVAGVDKGRLEGAIYEFASSHQGNIVVKPNVAALRSLGVFYLNKEGLGPSGLKGAVSDIMGQIRGRQHNNRISDWIIEEEVQRAFIPYGRNGDRHFIYYDIIPLIVGTSVIGTLVKYSTTPESVPLGRMPGQNPVIFSMVGVDGDDELARRSRKWSEVVGLDVTENGIREGPETALVKSTLRANGHITKAEEMALIAKRALEPLLESRISTLYESLAELQRQA